MVRGSFQDSREKPTHMTDIKTQIYTLNREIYLSIATSRTIKFVEKSIVLCRITNILIPSLKDLVQKVWSREGVITNEALG